MRKGLGRAARILMAAGALAVSRPAAAQGTKAEPPAASAESTLPAGQARLEELRVSLAWLTDPATFPLALTARVRGGSLEAGGVVPDDAVKEAALKLARQHTALPVVDALEVHAVKAPKRVVLPATSVQRQAAAVLSVAVGPRGRGMTVQARPDGQVTVRGAVGSLEEKLRISQRLRQVAGCTSVVNRLTLGKVAELPAPAAAARAPAGSLQEKMLVSQQLRQAGGRSLPAQTAAGEKVTAPATPTAPPRAPTVRVASVTPAPAPAAPAVPPSTPTVRVASVTPAPAPAATGTPSLSRVAPSLSAPEADLHLPGRGPKAPAGNMTVAGPPKAPAPAVVLEESEPPAPAHVVPKPVPPPSAVAGPMKWPGSAAAAPVTAYAPSPQVVPTKLRQRVLAATGGRAIAVQVLVLPDQSIRVRVRVASLDDEAHLSTRILQLPEMRAPNVRLEFQVAP